MVDTWILYDDVETGHHLGYVDRIVDAVQRAGIRPIVASPVPPATLTHTGTWIPVTTKSLRAVVHNWRQMRRVAAIGRRLGATTFIDLYLDKNVWASGALRSYDKTVHVVHHAIQYRSDVRRGWARVRTVILRRQLRRMINRGANVLVHTQRAAEIIGEAARVSQVQIVGYPVPVSLQRARRDRQDPPILLFTGAGRFHKGLDILIDALPLVHSHVRLRVVGAQPPGLRETLDPGDSSSITWINRRVTDDELWEEYEHASLAILPYRQVFGADGGASGVLLEMLGCGLPIVTTPGLSAQLPPDRRGAVVADSDNPADLANAIDIALDRLDELTDEASEVGPRFIAENHSYDRYVEALADAAKQTTQLP